MIFQLISNMKGALIFLAILILASPQQNTAVLALSWLAGFCESVQNCRPQLVSAWDHFTIHGFWPDKASPINYGQFNIDLFDGKLLADMKNYWPPQSKTRDSVYFLWTHQFDKHGSDFSNIYFNQHKKEFSGLSQYQIDDEVQQIYFETVIKLYQTLKVQKIPRNSYSKAQFATYLGLKTNMFSLVCNPGTANLQQIRICYDIRPSGSVVVPCTSVSARNCNNSQIVLPSWKKSSPTSPVTRA